MQLAGVKNPAAIVAIGLRVRQLREERGMSQQLLAYEADIAKLTVQRIEQGRASAGLDMLVSIAQALRVPLHELVRIDS